MRRHVIALFVGVFLVAACGSRLTDEQRAALVSSGGAAQQGQVGGSASTTTTTAGDGRTVTTSGSGGGDSSGGGDGGGDGGGATGGEDGGDGEAVVGGGSSCSGGGASDVGVTETEIKLGNVSTISGPIVGFGQTGVNAAKAYVNFVNASGGVCGRQLTLLSADDRLQSGTNKAETDKLKEQVLGFVGGVTVVDDGAAQALEGTNVALTGLAITDAMITSPNNFPSVPIDLASGGNGAEEIFKYMKAIEGVSRGGIVWPAQASAKARAQGYKTDMQNAGIEVVLETQVDVTETNYAGVAANVERNNVDVLVTTLEITGMSNLARDLQINGYFPKVPFYGAQAYGRDFIARAGDAAEPTVLGLGYAILEDAGSIQMVNDFLTWYERTNPGSDIDFFAIMSWVAADLYVSALRSVDGPPTRDKVLAALQGTTNYDASGMIAPINPAGKKGASCFVIAKVDGGKWVRDHPSGSGFECGY